MWQPIETAPKDGSIVVLWRPQPLLDGIRACSRIIGKWSDEENAWIWADDTCLDIEFSDSDWEENGDFYQSNEFTLWMPCPAPTA